MPYIGKQLSNGNYLKLDDISSGFDSSTTTFSLTNGGSAYYPGSEFSILVSVGGVIQEPESAYQINNDQIIFANAPTAQDSFFCIVLGDAIGINVPGNNTVNGAQMAKPFNYDGGLLYLNDTDNRVGINSTSPSVALDVVGDLNVSGNITGIGGTLGGTLIGNVHSTSGISTFNDLLVNGDLTVQGDTTTLNTTLRNVELLRVSAASTMPAGIITQTSTGDILRLYDSSTQVFTVTDGGKVGIGTDNPNAELDIEGEAARIHLHDYDGSMAQLIQSGNGFFLNLDAEGNGSGSLRLRVGGNTSASEKLRITSDGEVGIGTDNPNAQLDVYKTGTGTVVDTIMSRTSGGGAFAVQCSDVAAANPVWALRTYSSEDLVLSPGGHADVNEKVRIQASTGNVGIGTDNPSYRLQVQSDGNSTTAAGNIVARFQSFGSGRDATIQLSDNVANSATISMLSSALIFQQAGEETLRISSAGKVGIGSQIPQATLDVTAGGVNNAVFLKTTSDKSLIEFENSAGATYNTRIGSATLGSGNVGLLFETGTAAARLQAMVIDRYGKVGIGTASPTEKLDVRGYLVVAENIAVNRSRIVLSAPDGSSYKHLFGANLKVTDDGTFTTPTANISGGGWEYLPANSLDAHGKIRYLSAPDTNATTSTPEERLRIDGAGRVLIGVDSSTQSNSYMQVFKKTGDEATITVGNVATSATGMCRVDFSPSNKAVGARIECHATEDFSEVAKRTADLAFITRKDGTNSEKLRIRSDGKVAIGNETNNTSPTALFGVIADNGEAADLYVGKFHNLEATAGQSYGVDIRAGSNSTDHGLRVKNRANDTTQLIVRGDGNIGMGTANPSQPITISRTSSGQGEFGVRWQYTDTDGPTQTSSAILVGSYGFKFKNYNSSRDFLFETGRIGIGTDTMDSSADLSITNTGAARIYMKSGNDADCSIIFGAHDDTATGAIRYDHDDDSLRLYGHNNADRVRITRHGGTAIFKDGTFHTDTGWAGLEVRADSDTHQLVLSSASNASNSNQTTLGFKLHPSYQNERIKAAIVCQGSGGGYGEVSRMMFCIDKVGDNGNAAGNSDDERLRLYADQTNGQDDFARTGTGNQGNASQSVPTGVLEWKNNTDNGMIKCTSYIQATAGDITEMFITLKNSAFYRITIRASHNSQSASLGLYLVYGLNNMDAEIQNIGGGTNFTLSTQNTHVNSHDTTLKIYYSGSANQGLRALVEVIGGF